jgi:hypothetical protein
MNNIEKRAAYAASGSQLAGLLIKATLVLLAQPVLVCLFSASATTIEASGNGSSD